MSSVSSISALPSPVRPPRARYEYRTDARQGLKPCTSHTVSPPLEPSTPSHSPHSYASRSHRSSPPPPRTFTIRRGLVPLRAVPTLAMSMQVYAPTPIRSPRPLSPAVPSSNLPSLPSPQRPPMNRPSSRSERLLRDTLRRAEEQERLLNLATLPSSPPFCSSPPLHSPHLSSTVAHMFNASCQMPSPPGEGRRHRRSTSSSIQSDASADVFERSPQLNVAEMADEEDEADDDWYWRERSGASVSSSSSGHGPSYGQAYHCESDNRRKSLDKENGNGGVAYGSAMSPSLARPQLQRSGKSSPNVPRRTHAHTKSASHAVSRTSLDGERSPRRSHQPGALLTPHEAVLRTRLEGVLRGAKVQERKTRSTERGDSQVGSGGGSGSGNSMASSRNLSGEGDFFFGDSSLTSQVSNDLKPTQPAGRARTRTSFSPSRPGPTGLDTLPRLPRTPQKPSSRGSKSSSGSPSPLTPPPSPPFNARHAAAQIKTMDGYISFATIEGLGVPDGADDDGSDEDSKARSRWWQWLHLASGKAGDGARIDSANSAASH
ncbi:hypothetical protein A0H81_09274 [Grifola frondosa]|uniref:Uncharacterized protein n=1 Tax=Grifola frondosa TaxID=5627 RepID=A0A1C7M0Y0_GRIFR|nr:hypothetical protein A0H81_09274 [Grifola frondosa]